MNIHLLAESSPNPVLTAAMAELGLRHDVTVYDSQALPADYGSRPPADVVLLKSRTLQARQAASAAERAGSLVVNSPAATEAALDRLATARALEGAGVPAPRTFHVTALRLLAEVPVPRWPLVVKSRTSSRRDLVRLVRTPAELLGLLPEWGHEPVVVQEFAANDGFDIKVWVIGADLSAARRRSALESVDKTSDERLDEADLPRDWTRTARAAGAAMGLRLYGVDLLIAEGAPVVVDVNPFPGFRGARDPARSMLSFLSTLATSRTVAA